VQSEPSNADQPAGFPARVRAWRTLVADLFAAPAPPVRHRWLRPAVDLLLLAVMLTTVAAAQRGNQIPPAVLLGLTLAAWAPLPFRYRHPGPALAAAVLIESLHLVLLPILLPDLQVKVDIALYQPVPIATTITAFALAERARSGRGWIGGVIAGLLLLTVAIVVHPVALLGVDMVMFNVVVLGTGLGALIATRRIRAARTERAHRDHVEQQVTAERLRIARDLHDVLAHHLTLVNAQAGVANYLLAKNPDAAGRALRDIHRHTSDALDELRATVGLLRHVNDTTTDQPDENLRPVPGMSQLSTLIDGFRAVGAIIDADIGTLPVLPTSVDLAVYRIVQEALTNATKHAPGSPVRVRLGDAQHQLQVTVQNGPPLEQGPGYHRTAGTGNGLIGMRERARSCGGTVRTEPTSNGGFLVTATLPLRPTTEGTPK
jgi:signal transduction histidine kinase